MVRKISLVWAALLIFTSSGLFNIHAESSSGKKRIYIKNFETADSIAEESSLQIRNNIIITILENFGSAYRIISDDDISVMFRKAEELQAAGCNDVSCNLDIAQAMNADEIIYGNISRGQDEIKVTAYNLATGIGSSGRDSGIISMISVSFSAVDTDWMSREIALKLIDRKYKIIKAPRVDDRITLKPVEITPLKEEDIAPIEFERGEASLKAIVDHFSAMAEEGDILFNRNEHRNARLKYQEIITSINSKLTSESRTKIEPFINSINARISSSLAMEYKRQVERADRFILPENNPAEKDYRRALREYKKIEDRIRTDVPEEDSRAGMQKIIEERQDITRKALVKAGEQRGDNDYKNFRFNEALGNYYSAARTAKGINDSGLKTSTEESLYGKMETTLATGRNYLYNLVNSLIDRAEFYNVIDNTSDAKISLKEAREHITGPMGKFATDEMMDRYNDCAIKIPGSIVIDESTRKTVHKKMENPYDDKSFKSGKKGCTDACSVMLLFPLLIFTFMMDSPDQ